MSVEACLPATDPPTDRSGIGTRPDARPGRAGRIAGSGWLVVVAVVAFLSLSFAQIAQCPGVHYVEVLDWGLANNVYLLGDGRIRLQEVFGGATPSGTASGQSWSSIVAAGGVFLARPPLPERLRYVSPSHPGFRAALAVSPASHTRTPFFDRLGQPCAEVFEVEPAAKVVVSP